MIWETLPELAEKWKAVKFYQDHAYGVIYERLLESKRFEVKNMVEIGVDQGNSARVWLDYFNADLWGVDHSIEAIQSVNHPQFHGLFHDQTDKGYWHDLPDNLDLVIDDGSHWPIDQIVTLQNGFYKLKAGGLWFIEDCQTSFMQEYVPQGLGVFTEIFNRIIELQSFGYGYGDFYKAREAKISGLGPLGTMVYGVQVYKSLVILERALDRDGGNA